MDKKIIRFVVVFLIVIFCLQCYLIKEINDFRADVRATDQYLVSEINKTLGEIYEIQDIIDGDNS